MKKCTMTIDELNDLIEQGTQVTFLFEGEIMHIIECDDSTVSYKPEGYEDDPHALQIKEWHEVNLSGVNDRKIHIW